MITKRQRKSKPIAIIGAGQDKAAIAEALAKNGHNDVIAVANYRYSCDKKI